MKSDRSEQRLFVYGTLRNDSGHEMSRLLREFAEFEGGGSYQGRLYLVDEFPGAVPSRTPAEIVRGQIYRLRDPGTTLALLDEYEGCDPRRPGSNLYRRELVDIDRDDGLVVSSWIYLYNRSTVGLQRISSGDFLEIAEPSE